MLRITIELVPHGDETRARVLAIGTIVNTGDDPDRPARGSYDVTLYDGDRRATRTRRKHPYATGRVVGWPRLSRHVWQLLRAALDTTLRG